MKHLPSPGRAGSVPPALVTDEKLTRTNICICLCVLCGIAYWPVLSAEFLDWDDGFNVYKNLRLRELNLENLRWMFFDFGPDTRYKPITHLAWAIIHAFGGMKPFGYHLANLVLHSLNGCLLLLVLHRLILTARGDGADAEERRWLRLAAGAGALFWTVHPLRVETTAWVSVLSYSLVVSFLLLSVLVLLRCDFGRSLFRQTAYWLSLGLFQLATMSFALAVGFSIAVLALNVFPLRRIQTATLRAAFTGDSRRALIETLPFFAVTLLMCLVAIYGQHVKMGMWGAPVSLEALPLDTRLIAAVYYLGYYAWRPFYPFNHHSVNEDLVPFDPASPRILFAALVVAGLTIRTWARRKENPAAFAIWLAFIGLAGPALKLTGEPPFPGPGDRYSILCGLAASAAITGLMLGVKTPVARQRWLVGIAVSGLLFTLQSRRLSEVWLNNETFFSAQLENLKTGPTRSKAHCVLGRLASEAGDAGKALDHYGKAWLESPVVAAANIATAHAELLFATGQPGAVIDLLETARKIRPDKFRLDLYLGAALLAVKRQAEGMAVCDDVILRHPEDPDVFGFYASILIGNGNIERAREVLQSGLERHPGHPGLEAVLKSQGGQP